ncbi:hypothetical protein JW898_04670 [Candidatus Woesearchaeota archaeon]|nr:hypothetical protein [Candidatus Woesearchaeota archaeon]
MRVLIITGIAAFLLLLGLVRAAADVSRKSIEVSVALPSEMEDRNRSYIILETAGPYSAGAGESISMPLFVYRGSTLKRTVYVWLEDDGGVRVSSKSKYSLPERFRSYSISAAVNLSKCVQTGTYIIVAEGLDTNSTKEVLIASVGCGPSGSLGGSNQSSEIAEGDISFEVISSVGIAVSGIPFRTRLLVSNPTSQDLEVQAWSYVYRSSKCYSGEREENMKTVNVPEFSNVTFDLENTVIAPPGDYSLKIKFLRSDRKTPKETTLLIRVEGDSSSDFPGISGGGNSALSIENGGGPDSGTAENSSAVKRRLFSSGTSDNNSSSVVYESSSAKARKLTVYFIIGALSLILAALVFKKI